MDAFSVIIIICGIAALINLGRKKNAATAKPPVRRTPAAGGMAKPEGNAPKAAEVRGPAPAAQTSSLPDRVFSSMEGLAEETKWHDAEMSGEGSDPCHEEMYPDPHAPQIRKEHEETQDAREWARAVVMAEILQRPCDRRLKARGRA